MKTMLNKVPEVTLFFWVIKIMATTVGETAADYLSETLKLGLTGTSYIMSGLLAILLVIQLRTKQYVPGIYWAAVVLLSIVGTLISDNLVDNIGVSLITTTILFSSALAFVFGIWYLSERTLSVHTIDTKKRELFYWVAILFTFALGTSAGDLIAESSGLGYAYAALLFAALITMVFMTYRFLHLNSILAFWLAYIFTRPLGASAGDLLSQSADDGGLGLGTTITSIIFLLTIITLVIYLTVKRTKLANLSV
ncbi:MAG: hypothetical protein JWN56_842 [Sphingobacteriales bacterium]|nr:hypothetical protein [Sphingobacteriales bacterium]